MDRAMKHIVVAGGGITGLSAAFYVKRYCAEANIPVKITVIEKQAQFGGKVSTYRHDGFVIERGPDSFLARKTPIIDLTRELGLENELVPTNPEARKTFIMHSGKLHPMPPGLVLGIPTQLAPFIQSDLVSLKGKARALFDLVMPRSKKTGDESLGHFIERRLGTEVLERIVEPLLAGIYAGDTRELSLQATFPQFQQMEQSKRSLILGMMKGSDRIPSSPNVPDAVKGSTFLSFRNGLSTMIERLLEQLQEVERIVGEEVLRVVKQSSDAGAGKEAGIESEGNSTRYTIALSGGAELTADAVILAVPAYALARILPQVEAVEALGTMPYVSIANVVVGFNKKELPSVPDGSGFVIPATEGRFITACTWTSSKWGHAAPSDKVLLRCYVGRAGQEEWLGMDEKEIVERVMEEVRQTSGITATPEFTMVNRHLQSMPQYQVGHKLKITNVREQLAAQLPGVFVAGAAFEGVGLPDCIRQGRDAAKQVVDRFR